MPFIPHTDEDVRHMLAVLGIPGVEDLFDEIPVQLRVPATAGAALSWAAGLGESAISRLMRQRATQDRERLCFIGAGAYDHHIPAAVWELAGRGEFYSAYTPYQAEASQGTLQIIYEFQTMMAALTGLDISNASLYDGASALGEAVLMAARLERGAGAVRGVRRVLMPRSVHPRYRQVVAALVTPQGIELDEVACGADGRIDPEAMERAMREPFLALVLPQPNFFGLLEEVDHWTRRARACHAIVIGVVNPVALALLAPPGEWGDAGADIACGEGQPLGIPLGSGGPYLGFLCCRKMHQRQIPGRLVGRTVDRGGQPGFVLTLQTREQHIRRARATSNVCTNQGLMAIVAALHLALLGPDGLRAVARRCHANMQRLRRLLETVPGIRLPFDGPCFHETVVQWRPEGMGAPSVPELLAGMEQDGIAAGFALGTDYPELADGWLVCTTEQHSAEDHQRYRTSLLEHGGNAWAA